MPGTDLNSKLPNRRDIDGLRALSVLCVFLYHLEVPFLIAGGRRTILSGVARRPADRLAVAGQGLPVLILLIGAASLFAAQSRLTADAAGAFYLPIYRAYEFAIGALIIFAERHFVVSAPRQSILAALGFGLIAYAVIFFDGTTPFPGVNALIPCIGAACLIWAGPSHPLASLLTNPVAVRIGLISYSLYLVHWPLIVYAAYILGEAHMRPAPNWRVRSCDCAGRADVPHRRDAVSVAQLVAGVGRGLRCGTHRRDCFRRVSSPTGRTAGRGAYRRRRVRSWTCSGSVSGRAPAARSRLARSAP